MLTILILYSKPKSMKKQSKTSLKRANSSNKIKVLQKKQYNCFCKIFCCKCIHCCQSFDFSLLTSENRKNVFHSMIKEYIKSIEDQPNTIIDPFFILVGLLMGDTDNLIQKATKYEIDNPNENRPIFSKEDLQLYIPQLCTYLVFHEQMQKIQISDLLEETSKMDIQFAMKYFLYMRSLQSINKETQLKAVVKFNKNFIELIDNQFEEQVSQIYRGSRKFIQDPNQCQNQGMINIHHQSDIKPQNYHSIFTHDQPEIMYQEQSIQSFKSSIRFLDDLVSVGQRIMTSHRKEEALIEFLTDINKRLPAEVVLPLTFSDKHLKVVSVVSEECRIFQTKTRAPFYICLQAFETNLRMRNKNSRSISSTSIDNNLHRSNLFAQDSLDNISHTFSEEQDETVERDWLKPLYKLAGKAKTIYEQKNQMTEQTINNDEESDALILFGETQTEQLQRIRQHSPYASLPSYTLVHLMIKAEDDMRQQLFAMQLLKQFNNIFQMENLPIAVIPYEVIPLSHSCGIIQFLKDTMSIDYLRKKGGDFQFIRTNCDRQQKFMVTLVGYCLVTYFLQVKDRHNGNILIKRDGSIIHIDYGFFISNSPGKGVELQKNVPFKITSEYIHTLGGIFSKQFAEFRKLFYRGYEACRKHQHRILILTKLMFSSYGTTMACFQKGNEAIEAMQIRFNPTGIRTDGDLSLFCQDLINQSIDNWRAKWYDRWQYYFQGILY